WRLPEQARSGPAAAGLGPLQQVVHAAEPVGDPVLAAGSDEQDVGVLAPRAAAHAPPQPLARVAGAQDRPGLPVRALNRPGDDVLETAEDRPSLAGRLRGPGALVVAAVAPALALAATAPRV